MKSNLVWSSDAEVMEKKMEQPFSVWIVVEDCCNHFSGVFGTEQEAKFAAEGFGDGHSYFEMLV